MYWLYSTVWPTGAGSNLEVNMSVWNGIERRDTVVDRRKTERRRSMRYTADTLVIIDGVTWIDNEGTDRRRKIRRREDRERLARQILEDALV
ncbi:MAG: hypothetical protein V7641_3980 [Blastocatellia bacterium]